MTPYSWNRRGSTPSRSRNSDPAAKCGVGLLPELLLTGPSVTAPSAREHQVIPSLRRSSWTVALDSPEAPSDGVYSRALISWKEASKLTPVVSPPAGDRSPLACWPYRLVVILSNLRCHPAPVYLPGTADGHTLLRHCGGKEPTLEIARRSVGTWYCTILDRTPVPGGLSM